MNRARALFSAELREALAGETISYVDAGARGDLEEPWSLLGPELLDVTGFEPDAAECERLNAQAPGGRRYLPVALWAAPGDVEIHVARHPGCSSVHPPNAELLRRYRPEHREPRDTTATVSYPAVPLDDALADHDVRCDFLKVDTQGSEGEILGGATRVLRTEATGVLVETWTVEVHRGQALTGDVMRLLADHGFAVFDVGVAAAWRRPAPDELVGKAQVVGLDILAFRDPEPGPATLKCAAIADAYGFPDYAIELLDRDRSEAARAVRDAVVRGAAPRPGEHRGLLTRVGDRLAGRRPAPPEPEFPALHS